MGVSGVARVWACRGLHVEMASRMAKEFSFPTLPTANWFPGHMAKATRMLRGRVQSCDCVIEVHDARVSLFT